MTRCSKHAGKRAGWRCESCQQNLCPDCAAHSGLTNTSAVLCVHCGGLAQRLMVAKPRRPYWEMLPTFIKAIFSLEGVLQILAVSVAIILTNLIPFVGGVISKFIFISYYFRVILQAAHGAERLPEPTDFTDISDIIGPMLRFFMASLMIWLPAALYIGFTVGISGFSLKALSGGVVLLLVIAGVLYFPAAIIVAAISDSALAVINPAITVRMILRFPGEYLLTVAVWGLLNVLDGFIWFNLLIWGSKFHIPIFVPILVTMIGMIIPVFTGFILGRLIYQNAEHFKLLGKDDLHEPELPDAMPRGTREADAAAAVAPLDTAAALDLPPPDDDLEYGGGFASAPAPAAHVEPLDLPEGDEDLEFDPTSQAAPSEPTLDLPAPDSDEPDGDEEDDRDEDGGEPEEPKHQTADERLRAALRGDRRTEAIKTYQAIRKAGVHPDLTVRDELRLSGYLEQIGQFEEAVIACQRAAKVDMEGPFAPRAFFTAARLMAEHLDNPVRAKQLYQHVADNFPQDELSMYAADALRKLK